MRNYFHKTAGAIALLLLLLFSTANAQLTGVKTIPGDYASMALAFTDLNTVGVGAGGVTFNVAAGYTESSVMLTLTISINPPSATRPVVFQKSGAGADPLLTAGTGTGTTDGIIKLDGVDYVTFDGISIQENPANVTTTTQMEWGFALVKTGVTNGAQNNTIKNCTVTLNQANAASIGIYIGNHTAISTTGLTITQFSGTSSFNKFYNNTVQNSYNGYILNGFGSGAPYDLFDQGNEIGVDGISTRRSRVIQFGGGATQATGVTTLNQNKVKIFSTYFNNTGGLTSTGILYGIFTNTAANADIDIYGDTLVLTSNATTSNFYPINNAAGATGAGNTINIYNNVIDGCTYPTATTGIFRGINTSTTATTKNIYGNKVTNNTIPGTGEFACIYDNGSSGTLVLAENVYNNTITGNSKPGTGGVVYYCYINVSGNVTNFYNNTISGNTAPATSGLVYGYYNNAVPMTENVYSNIVSTITGGPGGVVGIWATTGGGTLRNLYGNTVTGLTCSSTTASTGGIMTDWGNTAYIYNNRVYNLTNNAAAGITPGVYGMNVGTNNNNDMNIYNNFISDLKAPSMSNAQSVYGLWFQGSTASVGKIYHNTVYLSATSTGVNFGTAAAFFSTTPVSLDIRNNIFVDASTPAGTGLVRAMARSTTTITNYSALSGNNCLYAGTPAANRLIYSDGTAADQTLQAFKNRVSPREQASFTELPPFVSVGTNDLHLLAGSPTQCESGGVALPAVTTDYDGVARSATFPDAGADEYGGTLNDNAPPDIQYTSLTNSGVATSRALTNFAAISDPSGVNNTAGTMPRIYYKKSTDANTYVDNTSATNGWKYTEATSSTSPFSFNIDYTRIFGGSVVAADIIQYFVTAQDLASSVHVGRNSGGFTAEPASVNLAAAQFPLNNTINQYTIVANVYTGVVNVGPAETVTSLTNAGGIFALINAGVLSGNLIINITGDLTAETGTNALNQWAEQGTGGYTITIAPSAAATRLISGSNAAAALIRFDGADRVTIDGRFGGTGSFLTFRNTSNAAPTIGLINDAQSNTIRNAIIESGNTATSTTLGGAILIGTGLATGTGNDNNTITSCEIRDRSDVAGTPCIGINVVGTNTTNTGFNSGCTFSNNNIHDWFLANNANQFGINIGAGNSSHTISGNSFYQTATRTQTVAGAVTRAININFSSIINNTGGYVITNNYIGGTAPACTGGDMTLTVSGATINQAFSAISVASGMIPNSIQGNIIRKIDYTVQNPAASASVLSLIFVGQGIHNVGTTSGNIIGDSTGNDLIKVTVNVGGAGTAFLAHIFSSSVNGYSNIQNNVIGGISTGGTATVTVIPQYIQIQGTPSSGIICNNNFIGSSSTANSIRHTTAGTPLVSFGARSVISSGASVTMNNNTVRNVTGSSTNTGSIDFGIFATSTVGGKGTITMNNNTVRDFSNAAAPLTPSFTTYAMALQSGAGQTHSISGNTIRGIVNTNTGATASGYVAGIQTQGASSGGSMNRNKISDLRNAGTSGTAGTVGIYISSGDQWTVSNNMISLSNTGNTNTIVMTGIVDVVSAGVMKYYYNTVYIGGSTAAGANNSYAFGRQSNSTITLKNNLFYNERTGGTGFHYAIGNISATPTDGWNGGYSDYNFFITPDATRLGEWGTGIGQTLAQWRTSSSCDAASRSDLNSAMPSATIFAAPATANLKINTGYYLTPTYLESRGTVIAGITTDQEGDSRPGPAGSVNGGGTAPDIGADEFDGTPANYDASDFALILPATTGCHGAADSVVIQIKNTGNLTLNFATTPITINAAVTGPNPATFGPVTVNSGTLAVGATQNVVMSTSYNMTAVGTYTFTSSITMSSDDVAANNTLTAVNITISGGTASASPLILCEGASTSLSVTGFTNGGTIQWQDSVSGGGWANIGGATTTPYSVTPGLGTTFYRAVICGINTSNVVSVLVNDNPVVNLGPDSSFCSGTIVLDAANPGATYIWSTTAGTQTISVTSAGTYSVTVTDGALCQGVDTIVVIPGTPAIVDLGADTVQCGGTIDLDAENAGYTYLWSTTETTQIITVSSSGSYYVDVFGGGLGCIGTDTINVTFSPDPVVNLGPDSILCAGTIVFDAGNPGSSYLWSTSAITQTESITSPGTYYVDVTNVDGCTSSDTVVVTAGTLPVVNLGPDTAVCGGPLLLDAGNPGSAYFWSTTEITQTISVTTSGIYSVDVTNPGLGCDASDDIDVTINALPAVTFNFPDDTVCFELGPVTITGESPAGGTWSGPGVSGSTFDPAVAGVGVHTLTYTYTDGATGCTNTAIDVIVVDICIGTTTPQAGLSMELYPNPNKGLFVFTISGISGKTAEVDIFDAPGRKVWSDSRSDVSHTYRAEVDLTTVSAGVYMIRALVDGNVHTLRVVIE